MQAALRDALEWQGRRASPRLLVWCTFRSEGRSRLAAKAKGTRGVPCRAEQVPHPLFLMQLIKPNTGGGPDSSPHLSLQHLGCSGKAGVGGQAAGPTPAATNQTSPGRSPPPLPGPSSNSAEGPQGRTRRHPGGSAHSRNWTSHPPTQLSPAASATSTILRKHKNNQEIIQKDPAGRIPGARPVDRKSVV